jgi:hypothetical protein
VTEVLTWVVQRRIVLGERVEHTRKEFPRSLTLKRRSAGRRVAVVPDVAEASWSVTS